MFATLHFERVYTLKVWPFAAREIRRSSMANARALQSLAHTPLQTSIVDQKQMLARTELPRRLLSAFGFLKKLAGQSSAVMLLSSGRHSVRATSPLFGLVQTGGNLLQDRAGLRSRRARVLCQSADSNTSQVRACISRTRSNLSVSL